MVCFIVAQAMLEKFGGDSMAETKRNNDAYVAHIARRIHERVE
jgi:chorismate synthase